MSPVLFRRIFSLLLICLACLGLIVLLYKISDAPNVLKNAFERNLGNEPRLEVDYFTNLHSSSTYFAGKTSETIFLGESKDPNNILETDYRFKNLRSNRIQPPISEHSNMFSVDSPFVYFSSGDGYFLLVCQFMKDGRIQMVKTIHIPVRFTLNLTLFAGSYIFRTIDTIHRENSLSKLNDSKDLFFTHSLMEKQGDGFFSTDGILQYDHDFRRILYVYFYRNQFLCLDTNINLIYRGQTIDTNKIAKLNIKKISGSELFTFSKPPVVINQHVSVNKGCLYILSGLLADNENRQAFSKSSVIDVYNLSNGKYIRSFHVQAFDGSKIHDFIVTDQALIALQGDFIVRYPFSFKSFSDD